MFGMGDEEGRWEFDGEGGFDGDADAVVMGSAEVVGRVCGDEEEGRVDFLGGGEVLQKLRTQATGRAERATDVTGSATASLEWLKPMLDHEYVCLVGSFGIS